MLVYKSEVRQITNNKNKKKNIFDKNKINALLQRSSGSPVPSLLNDSAFIDGSLCQEVENVNS